MQKEHFNTIMLMCNSISLNEFSFFFQIVFKTITDFHNHSNVSELDDIEFYNDAVHVGLAEHDLIWPKIMSWLEGHSHLTLLENVLRNIAAVFFGIVFEFQRPLKDASMGPRID